VEAYSTAHLPALLILFLGWALGFVFFLAENVVYKWSFEEEIVKQIIDTPAPICDGTNTLPTETALKKNRTKKRFKRSNTFERFRGKSR